MKPVLARQMEVYAGFLEHTDHHVGLLIDALKDSAFSTTPDLLIIGDNGASAEGSLQGCFNEMAPLTGFPQLETAEFLTERLDKLGGPRPTTITPWDGRTRCARPTSGPSRSPRTLAAPQRDDRALAQGIKARESPTSFIT